ncbi:HD domain-containing protein [Roseovarius sp. MMSF_3359]|nr:HD domain-containing protein [Roseovarius sp. MMSF_3359]
MIDPTCFAPHERIAGDLLPVIAEAAEDGSHDLGHILRVWRNVQRISRAEGGDQEILVAATILHDCVAVSKNTPQRSSASALAAQKASDALRTLGWPEDRIRSVYHAIEAHSFSADIMPQTVEAMILQDADRLDAIGHIGIARCFYVAGRLGTGLYDPDDPRAENRTLDDRRFAIDHFRTKLLRLSTSFQTATGRALAAERHKVMCAFLDGLEAEIAVQADTP